MNQVIHKSRVWLDKKKLIHICLFVNQPNLSLSLGLLNNELSLDSYMVLVKSLI